MRLSDCRPITLPFFSLTKWHIAALVPATLFLPFIAVPSLAIYFGLKGYFLNRSVKQVTHSAGSSCSGNPSYLDGLEEMNNEEAREVLQKMFACKKNDPSFLKHLQKAHPHHFNILMHSAMKIQDSEILQQIFASMK